MAKGKSYLYAVVKGRVPGIYSTWDDCKAQTEGFSKPLFQKFASRTEAEAWIASNGASTEPELSTTSTSTSASAAATSINGSATMQASKSKGKKRSFDQMQTPDLVFSETSESAEPLVVFSDGACKGNGKKTGAVAGIGVWWGPNDERNLAERCPGAQTNNRAELIAICRVLESTPYSRRLLTIKTDSKYSINCFENWIHNWRARGWKTAAGAPVKNPELIQYISELLSSRITIGQKVRLEYVKGHAGIEGNEGADYLANRGAALPEEEERDWSALEKAYKAQVDDLIKARRLRQTQKAEGSFEVVGAEEAKEDFKNEVEAEVMETEYVAVAADADADADAASTNKVRRVGDTKDASVKDFKQAVIPAQMSRRYSAGVSEPSAEDLEAFAEDSDEGEEVTSTPTASRSKPSESGSSPSKLYSVGEYEPSDAELDAYAAAAWDDSSGSDY